MQEHFLLWAVSGLKVIPHTAVCGYFRSDLQEDETRLSFQSHTRECVDTSDPTHNANVDIPQRRT